MNIAYRIYHRIDVAKRVEIMDWATNLSRRSWLFGLFWNKIILRYHYLVGHQKGLTLEVTDRCNLKCIYCPKSLDIGIGGAHMDWEIFEKVFDGKVAEGPLDRIILAGFGEPFLFPYMEKAIKHIKKHDPAIWVTTTSNGTKLNGDWGRKLAKAGLNQITISVNASSKEQYKRINAADIYDRVVENATEFLDAVNSEDCDMTVFIQILGNPVNDEVQIQQFRKFWKGKLGRVGTIQVQPFVNWAGQIDAKTLLNIEERARQEDRGVQKDLFEEEYDQRKEENKKQSIDKPFGNDKRRIEEQSYPCYHIHKSRNISREGNVLACCMVFPGEMGGLSIGNLKEKTYKELYHHGKLKDLQRLDLDGKLSQISPCDTCDAWKTVPNIWWRNPIHKWMGTKWM